MLTPEEIRKLDRSSICSAYDSWPEYCSEAFSRDVDVSENLFNDVSSIVFAGMGGSGTTGDIIADWMRLKCVVPIHVLKGYHLPAFVGDGTLVIAMSVSGNTEETLSAMTEAVSAGARVVAVSQGGEMEKICRKKNLAHVKIRQRILPRITLPEVLYSVLKLLIRSPFLGDLGGQIGDSIKTMQEVGKKISQAQRYEENPAKQLAGWMLGRVPVAFCSPLTRGVGIRFKNSVNENAKAPAAAFEILDSCHNEIVAWASGGTAESGKNTALRPILVRNMSDLPEFTARFDVFKEMLQKNGHEVYEVPVMGNGALSSIVASLYLLDYATVYLGILRGLDPAPIDAIFELKDLMARRLNYFEKFVRPKLD